MNAERGPPQDERPLTPSASFVYPTKSLLRSNRIQPAESQCSTKPRSPTSPELTRWIDEVDRANSNNAVASDPNTSSPTPKKRVGGRRSSSTAPTSSSEKTLSRPLSVPGHSLNIRHFPREGSSPSCARYPSECPSDDLLVPPSDSGPHIPPPPSALSQEGLSSQNYFLFPEHQESTVPEAPIPLNVAEAGLVRLGPARACSSIGSSGHSTSSGQSQYFTSRGASTEGTPSMNATLAEQVIPSQQVSLSSKIGPSDSAKEPQSDGRSDEAPFLTVRFQAVEDDHGHHVVMGREGTLARCEDEPIRTPGAVQSFGVLIAVDQQEDILLVRQVSENSTDILGLSPQYLFALECFTDTLPEQSAGVLWTHIDHIAEPDPDFSVDNERDSKHPFSIILWGGVDPGTGSRKENKCWCAVHRPPNAKNHLFVLEFELEEDIIHPLYPSNTASHPANASGSLSPSSSFGSSFGDGSTGGNSTEGSDKTLVTGDAFVTLKDTAAKLTTPLPALEASASTMIADHDRNTLAPSTADIMESTTPRSKPLQALERLRRMTRRASPLSPVSEDSPDSAHTRRRCRRGTHGHHSPGGSMMDMFAVMDEINYQLDGAPDLETFLNVIVGVVKDLTGFHRVLIYQFDDSWNGQVVAELVDWSTTHDLYKGLHFPAGDIPAQARNLYMTNKVRILYDRDQPTARIVVRSKEDLAEPLDMTYCYLRAMSPIHIKYLGNMGVRASMSVSIMAFGSLWGLVACHGYGARGMRVSFPVRTMLQLLGQSISRNIERLSYAKRLHTRKLINTLASDSHPTGYIVSNADDLLGLFDADFGILVIGDGAKTLGPNENGQEVLIMAEYLRLKQFTTIQASQSVSTDYPELNASTGLFVVAGLLYVPLSSGGNDFIAFLRKGQPRNVHWAGKPSKDSERNTNLEPRKSFRIWSEIVASRCRAWTDEQLETAGVLALVYGKFIEVWRQRETALQATKMTSILLENASHEVRTPLNHIINYLELALSGPLDAETRENLVRSHTASKSLLFTINDLLALTRNEPGEDTSFHEPFDLRQAIEEAVSSYKHEAERRSIEFKIDLSSSPRQVIGDAKKIQTVVQNLTANALKYTTVGSITVCCTPLSEPEGLRDVNQTAVEITVADSGQGIAPAKLESIFREFEQIESSQPTENSERGVGLGLAVVGRIVEQLGGQLRVDSKVEEGSRFSFLIPLALVIGGGSEGRTSSSRSSFQLQPSSHRSSIPEITSFVEALSSNHMSTTSSPKPPRRESASPGGGVFEVTDSHIPLRPLKIGEFERDIPSVRLSIPSSAQPTLPTSEPLKKIEAGTLRVLIVEDNELNQRMLAKRLAMNGHEIVNAVNGQEALDLIKSDQEFDCILMDLNMPILDGYQASREIRLVEESPSPSGRLSRQLNGRMPIFAVSASCVEQEREKLSDHGMDGWILKPINFKRLAVVLSGVLDVDQRQSNLYTPGCHWENGGWLQDVPGQPR